MLIKRLLQSWKIYLWFLIVNTALIALLVLYTAVSATGTDSGLSVVAGLVYLIGAVIFLALSTLLGRWLKARPRLLVIYLGFFWSIVVLGSILVVVFLQGNVQRNARNDDIAGALQPCSIEKVTWTYDPALLLIEYTDRSPVKIDIRTDPAFVETQVHANKLRCNATYDFVMNGQIRNY